MLNNKSEKTAAPYRLQRWVEITTNIGCDNMCIYCPQEKLIHNYFKGGVDKPSHMAFKVFKKSLSHIPQRLDICFTGMSEPLLNKQALKMMSYADKKGYNVHLYTTFKGASKKDINQLKKIHVRTFVIHLPDNSNMMKLKVDREYLEKLDLFQKYNFPNVTYTCIGQVHAAVKEIIKGDIQETRVNLRAGNVEGEDYQELLDNSVNMSGHSNREYDQNKKVICNRRLLSEDSDERMTLPEATILLPDGSLTLCCMDWELKYVLGNLYHCHYDEIINGKKMHMIEDSMMCKNDMEILCRKCEYSNLYNV